MKKNLDKKITKISERMQQLQEELALLEKEKSQMIGVHSPEIKSLANEIIKLAHHHQTDHKFIINLLSKKISEENSADTSHVKQPLAPKYRDPADHNNTWSGRGLTPLWLKRYESIGKSRDEFLI